MKRRTSIEYSLQDYIWGVQPISIQCERDYQTQFQLYFQKSLQIISQHETTQHRISKGEVVDFGPPSAIQPFRVQSDKNMEYKWSLYIKRQDFMGNNEEFLQGIHVNLQDEWNQYKEFRRSCYKRVVTFVKMKIKFSFLIIIAINNKDLEEAAQRYLSRPESQSIRSEEKYRRSETNLTPESSIATDLKTNQQTEQEKGKSRNSISYLDPEPESSQKSIPLYPQSEQNSAMQPPPQTQFLQPQPSPSKLDNDNKLSNSDLQLGNQLQEKIHTTQQKQPAAQNFLKLIEDEEQTKVQKSIRMTSSQLLNSHGIPIVPFYKKKAFIFVLLAFLLLIAGHFFMSETEKPVKKKMIKQKKEKGKDPKEASVKPKKKKVKARG